MGYSNVQGDLNVLSTTSTQNLTVRGDTTLSGNLTAISGFHNFGNVTAGNLVVTGNFTVTATNTQVTNSLSINNFGTTTALKVVQYEGGGAGHSYNVAEFWDFQTLAMVIDPEGNVGIHTTSSPGYSLTVGDGSYLTTVTSQLYTGNGSGISNLHSSNLVGALTSLQLSNTQSNITSLGTLVNLNVSGTANIATGWFTTANVTGGLGANTAFFNLLKTNTSNTGFLNAANGAVSNLLCANINVVTTANMAALTVTGILNGGLHIGNASGLSNLNSSNLVGNVANANVALVVSQPAQPNVTSVGILSGLNVSGTSNLSGTNVTTANVESIFGTNLNVTGTSNLSTVTALLYIGNASGLSNLNSSNLFGNVANANVALVVSQPAQPNVTSVGILTGLNVSGTSNLLDANITTLNAFSVLGGTLNVTGSANLTTLNVTSANIANIYTTNIVGFIGSQWTTGTDNIYYLSNVGIGTDAVSANLHVIGNVFASNALSTGNLFLTGTANVLGVSNLATTNVTTLNGDSVLVGTLNVTGTSNLSTTNVVSQNVITSNVTIMTVSGNVIVGPTPTAIQANLHVEQGSIFIGNSAAVGATLNTTSITQGTLVFDNTANASIIPNKIVLFSNAAGGIYAGFGVSGSGGDVTYRSRSTHIFYTGVGATAEVGRLGSSGGLSLGSSGTNSAKLYVAGAFPNSNIHVRIDSSNIALVTSGAGLVGFGTITPSANLHVIGNVFATNALSTANLFLTGTANIQGASNLASTNVTTLNAASLFGTNLNVTGTSNLSTTNVTTLNAASVLGGTLNVTGTSNLSTTNVTTINAATANVTNLTVRILANIYDANVPNTVFTNNIYAAGFTSNATNTVFNFDTLIIPYMNVTTTANISALNVVGTTNLTSIFGTNLNVTSGSNLASTNITTLNAASIFGTNLNVTSGSNLASTNITTLNAASIFGTNLNVTGTSNLSTTNVTTINAATANITNLTVSSQANIFSSNIVTANVQTLNVATPILTSSGLYMNLNATYTLNATGNWYGNVASTLTSNLYTLFAPDPVASWTTYGSNPLVTGPSANGGFKFSQTGPWAFTVVITADNNIKTVALSSNTSDVHSNLADTDVWEYVYRIGVGQDPSTPITIPFYVDNASKYYFLDIESTNQTDNIHRTRYTNTASEAYTGSYVVLKPV